MSLPPLDPRRAALLVVDMQNAFCHPEGTLGVSGVDVEPARRVIEPVRRLVVAFRDAGLPVVWTRQVHLDPDAGRARKQLASHTQKRARVSALAGSWDAEIVEELQPFADDPTYVVAKHRFGAFYDTRLETLLRMLGVDTLFVTGTTANACIETTLREAYLRDLDVVAVTDAIAAVRPAWLPVAEEVWAQYLGVLATCDEVLAWLDEAREPRALGLHHVLLETSDLERAEGFWVGLLGLEVRDRQDFRGGRRLVTTRQGIGLVDRAPGSRGGLEHVCLAARGIDELARRASAAGVEVVRGPGPGPYGHTVYLRDPDGNEVELVETDAARGPSR